MRAAATFVDRTESEDNIFIYLAGLIISDQTISPTFACSAKSTEERSEFLPLFDLLEIFAKARCNGVVIVLDCVGTNNLALRCATTLAATPSVRTFTAALSPRQAELKGQPEPLLARQLASLLGGKSEHIGKRGEIYFDDILSHLEADSSLLDRPLEISTYTSFSSIPLIFLNSQRSLTAVHVATERYSREYLKRLITVSTGSIILLASFCLFAFYLWIEKGYYFVIDADRRLILYQGRPTWSGFGYPNLLWEVTTLYEPTSNQRNSAEVIVHFSNYNRQNLDQGDYNFRTISESGLIADIDLARIAAEANAPEIAQAAARRVLLRPNISRFVQGEAEIVIAETTRLGDQEQLYRFLESDKSSVVAAALRRLILLDPTLAAAALLRLPKDRRDSLDVRNAIMQFRGPCSLEIKSVLSNLTSSTEESLRRAATEGLSSAGCLQMNGANKRSDNVAKTSQHREILDVGRPCNFDHIIEFVKASSYSRTRILKSLLSSCPEMEIRLEIKEKQFEPTAHLKIGSHNWSGEILIGEGFFSDNESLLDEVVPRLREGREEWANKLTSGRINTLNYNRIFDAAIRLNIPLKAIDEALASAKTNSHSAAIVAKAHFDRSEGLKYFYDKFTDMTMSEFLATSLRLKLEQHERNKLEIALSKFEPSDDKRVLFDVVYGSKDAALARLMSPKRDKRLLAARYLDKRPQPDIITIVEYLRSSRPPFRTDLLWHIALPLRSI